MRDEGVDAALPRGVAEDVEHRGAEPSSLHRVHHGERDLGRVGARRQANESRNADEVLVAIERHDRDVIPPVDLREVRQHRWREIREVREKPLVARLGREPVERGAQRGGILGPDAAENDGLAADDAIGAKTWSYLHGAELAPRMFRERFFAMAIERRSRSAPDDSFPYREA